MITIGLAGNPNAGKSTIFNALTGSRQHVGNWPGKTVEKKEGRIKLADQEIVLVDLPGTYSLSAFSVEELIARDFIVEGKPNVVVCVVDAANLERNLYLVTQILEMSVPVIIALNMSDVAESRGIKINRAALSAKLGGLPIIQTVGNAEIGIDTLKNAIIEISRRASAPPVRVDLGPVLEPEMAALETLIERDPALKGYSAHWLAIKLLEADEALRKQVEHNTELIAAVDAATHRIIETSGDEPDTLIADARYSFIGALVKTTTTRPANTIATTSDKLDRVLTHRWLGLPIFLLLMWIVFQITTNVSAPFLDFVDGVIAGPVSRWVVALLTAAKLGGSWVEALLVNGVIAGVGSVLVFVPVLASLYLAIGILEDSGYMARAAFVMDRSMSRLGLHGKSFLPLLVGFGCTVPAIYATRTLENERDRKITGFLATFMSCGARLPVYVLFGTAFFGAASGNLIFAMYVTGIAIAVITSLLFTKVIYRNKPVPPFVMELPPYRAPNARIILRSVVDRTSAFVRKAGTIILSVSIVVWLLLAIPAYPGAGSIGSVAPSDSIFGSVSRAIAPVFAPAGFGTWQASGALVTGILAKEVVISTLSQTYVGAEADSVEAVEPQSFGDDLREIATSFAQATILTGQEIVNIIPRTLNLIPVVHVPELNVYGTGEEEAEPTALEAALTGAFSPLTAVAFCVFILLYVPCMTAVTAMRHEFGTRWMLMQSGYALGVAWLVSTIVYQVGHLVVGG